MSGTRTGLTLSLAVALGCALWISDLRAAGGSAADDDVRLWQAVRTGTAIAVMRHALAPGTGDPANFTLDDCATQRTLSDEGRRQARSIGGRFRDNGISSATVFSSAWCRCRETAELLDLGPVTTLPLLNSFFRLKDRQRAQTRALKEWLSRRPTDQAQLLVTHQVNITALTGVFPRSGEIVVVHTEPDGEIRVLGTL